MMSKVQRIEAEGLICSKTIELKESARFWDSAAHTPNLEDVRRTRMLQERKGE
jgi:hypothetical protein